MIHTYLDLSTGHLKQETMETLGAISAAPHASELYSRLNWPAMTIAPYLYGVFITVPDPEAVSYEQYNALPADLAGVIKHAQNNNIPLIRFDSDGDRSDSLPFYTW